VTTPTTVTSADVTEWCAAIGQLASGQILEPAALFALYDTLEAHAPPEIGGDMAIFLRLGREVSNAFANAIAARGTPKTDAQWDAVIRAAAQTLSPEGYQFLIQVALAKEKGQPPGRPMSTIFTFMQTHCP